MKTRLLPGLLLATTATLPLMLLPASSSLASNHTVIKRLAPMQLFNCAKGFNKTLHKKDNQGGTLVLQCTTPTIKCPPNSKYAGLIIEHKSAKVGGGMQFRYTCKYFKPPK